MNLKEMINKREVMVKELNNWLKIYFEAVDNYKTNEEEWLNETLELEVDKLNNIVNDITNDLNEVEEVLDGIIAYDEDNITREYMVNELSNWTKLYHKAIEEYRVNEEEWLNEILKCEVNRLDSIIADVINDLALL